MTSAVQKSGAHYLYIRVYGRWHTTSPNVPGGSLPTRCLWKHTPPGSNRRLPCTLRITTQHIACERLSDQLLYLQRDGVQQQMAHQLYAIRQNATTLG